MLQNTGRFENLLARRPWLRYLPWAVLAVTLAGSWQLWQIAERHAMQARQVEFDMRAQGVAERIRQRMLDYEQLLYGVRGFVIHQQAVTHREYSGYIEALQLAQEFRGMQDVSYVPLITPQRKQQHIAAMRQDGLAGYVIRTEGGRGELAPVAYIAPGTASNLSVLGLDYFSSPQRRASMEQARDLDRAVVSGKLALAQDEGAVSRPACQIFLPVYKAGAAHATQAARRAGILGWVAASFRVNDLLEGLLSRDAGELDIDVYDSDEASGQVLLFGSGISAEDSAAAQFKAERQLEIAGRIWRVTAASRPAFEEGLDKSKARLTALSAFLLSIVLSWVTAVLVRDRGRALRLAEGASTELRQSQKFQSALQESERRWKLALEAAGHGVWDWDMQTDAVVCSELSMRIIGCTPDDYPDSFAGWKRLVHPEDLPQVLAAYELHLQGKAPFFNTECRVLNKDGGWTWIISRAMVVERDERGKPLRMLGTHTDIGERRAMQAAMEEQKQFSDSIIDSLPGNFYMLDANGHQVRWNKNAEIVTGYTAEEMAGLSALDFFEEDERAAIQKALQEVFEKGEVEVEAGLLTKDGRKIPYHFRARRSIIGGKPYVIGVGIDVSESKASEIALRESEERYRSIFNSANYFVFTLDTASRITFAPPIVMQVSGYAPEELIGSPISKILTAESWEKAQRMLTLKLRGEAELTQYENELICKDGRIIPIEVNTSLIYKQGKVVGVQGVGRDISERYQFAQSLRENEEKYRGLFESAGDFAYSTDLGGNFTALSETLWVATGYGRGELKSIAQILSPDQLALAQKMTALKLAGEKQTTRYELELTARDGRTIPIEIVSTLVYKNDVPIGVQGIGREIAERKRAEELLRSSERKYRELMEQAAEAIFVTDREWRRCEEVNQAACDLLGYTREEMLRLDVGEIFHPGQMAGVSGNPGAEKAGVSHTLRRFRRKDGSYIPVELSSRMLPDGRLQAFARDISPWVERESALQEANNKAEAASHAKSEFLANMSHEIRTPMNSVIGMARLALSRETDMRQIGYLEKILMSGEHLLDIIDDILDFSKIEAGKMHIENTDFELRSVMDNLASLVADKALAKGLEFVMELDPALPARIQGDPLRLRQVLLNFADNAIKFTARGKVRVSARRLSGQVNGCSVVFEVSDTGIGMTQEEIAKLFRPFQQTDGSITRKFGGTGLGLSISKRLVELMGGKAGVESEPGRGSRFWFCLRLDEGRQNDTSSPDFGADGRDAQAAIRHARILLAENNVFNQQVAREFLEAAGCVVQVANNGAEAQDWLQREHFDCVLMDVQMPLMDGLEATRRIRANQAYASMPVIAVTANALEEERQRCLEAGMNDFITKPLRPETLYAVLAKWLSRQAPPLVAPERRKEPGGMPAQGGVLNLAVLAELVGDNRETMHQMVRKFMDCTRRDMDKVAQALEGSDTRQLKELAHHIKSPAAMVGAAYFAELCSALEGSQGDLEHARAVVGRMQAMLEEIEMEIEAQFP
ncbi:MAG TPA: PAS domain S-box protein [Gallionellaceae bacterium]